MNHTFLKKSIKISMAVLILALSCWYLYRTYDWTRIGKIIVTCRLEWIMAAVGCGVLFTLFRALRWYYLLYRLNIVLPFFDIYISTVAAIGLALVTPMQSGEMIKMEWLKKYHKISRTEGYSTFAVERILDLLTVVVIAIISVVVSSFSGLNDTFILVCCLLTFLFLVVGTFLFLKVKVPKLLRGFQTAISGLLLNLKVTGFTTCLTLAGWLSISIAWHFSLLSVGIQIDYNQVFLMMALVMVINILSFIPGGIGVSEVGVSIFLIRAGQETSLAQTGSLIMRVFGLLFIGINAVQFLIWKFLKKRN